MIRALAPLLLAALAGWLVACTPDLPPTGPRDGGPPRDAPIECATGTTLCGPTCVDTLTSAAHCGGCGLTCDGGEVCADGACACAPGFTQCGDRCVDVTHDPQHCGGCDQPCGTDDNCSGGACGACGTGVSLARDVQPIFTRSCATSPCHGGARPAQDVALDAARMYASVVGVTSSCRGTLLVAPGDPDASYLVHKIEGTHECGGQRMPSGSRELTAAEEATIRDWICGGARDD